MNLVILTDSDLIEDDRYRLTDNRAEHIRSILKLKSKDTIEVGLLNGPAGIARILKVSENEIILSFEKMENKPIHPPEINLICALPRPQTLKKVLITSAMMGVRHLHLIRANRVEKSYFQSPLLEPENFRPYLIEGLSQGKLTYLPEVRIYNRFRRFFEDTLPSLEKKLSEKTSPRQIKLLKLLTDPESDYNLKQVFNSPVDCLILAIGPEGGWVPFEMELMERVGFCRFNLGRWILRVENAVTATLAQVELLNTLYRPDK